MTRPMTRKLALVFATTLVFTLSACDSDSDADQDVVDERAAEQDASADVDAPEHHAEHGRRNPAERLCAELDCSEAQKAEITALFAAQRPDGDQREALREARHEARAEAHQAIADAFRADSFDARVLERVAPEPPTEDNPREDRMVALAVGLHGILTAEQRAELADRIAAGGPMLFGGRHGKHGKRGQHDPDGDGEAQRDPAERVAMHVDRFCADLTCSEAQVERLTAVFTEAHAARREARAERKADKPDFSAIAALMRAETLDEAALRAALAEARADGEDRRADKMAHKGETLAEIHAILTPAQRGLVADKIAAGGVRSALGMPEHHDKRGGKRKGRGKRPRHG